MTWKESLWTQAFIVFTFVNLDYWISSFHQNDQVLHGSDENGWTYHFLFKNLKIHFYDLNGYGHN